MEGHDEDYASYFVFQCPCKLINFMRKLKTPDPPKWEAWISGVDPLLLSMLTSALAAISILTISWRPLCAATDTAVIPAKKA